HIRRGARRRDRPRYRQLAHGRWHNVAAGGESGVGGPQPFQPNRRLAYLGRRHRGSPFVLVGVLGSRGMIVPPSFTIRDHRLQLTANFNFDDAAEVVPYLKQLGITHLYASPFMKARKGSTHGYDIIDHTELNPELGGEAGFARLCEALRRHDLGLILDFVPN